MSKNAVVVFEWHGAAFESASAPEAEVTVLADLLLPFKKCAHLQPWTLMALLHPIKASTTSLFERRWMRSG